MKTFETEWGKMFQGDCLDVMERLVSESVDLVFADPPFNLKKNYSSGCSDDLTEEEYLKWSESWIIECFRVLKEGGSFFLWNIPYWNSLLSPILHKYGTFRHWITVDMKNNFPIRGRLFPSHYSLLYFIKGEKPSSFHPDRLPVPICRSCSKDLKDYGGHKKKLNPNGLSLTDVWLDISPVRHQRYKHRKENQLPVKLLDRVIEMATEPGDVVFDPFGGAGTTYAVAEIKERRWIGIELGEIEGIAERLQNLESEKRQIEKIRSGLNVLFSEETKEKRRKSGIWIPEDFHEQES